MQGTEVQQAVVIKLGFARRTLTVTGHSCTEQTFPGISLYLQCQGGLKVIALILVKNK